MLDIHTRNSDRNSAGARPCQGRGRGFESLRPLQDLADLTTVGKCARGNIWGNSTHITNAFWRSARASFQQPAEFKIPIIPPVYTQGVRPICDCKIRRRDEWSDGKKGSGAAILLGRELNHCIDRSSQTRPSRHKLTIQPRLFLSSFAGSNLTMLEIRSAVKAIQILGQTLPKLLKG